MIQIEEITIKEFRGVRDFTLCLKKNNFAICGPNGTGKSGIVDAIEFALTGNISRLSGSGTGGISVKVHGPHVDSRNDPEKASVTLKVWIPSIAKSAIIHRTVKNANKPTITPNNSDIEKALTHVVEHPEFVLSRRELIRYILSEPGKRSQEVQALLRLEGIESLRKVLHKVSNSESKNVPGAQKAKEMAGENLSRAMNIGEVSEYEILTAVNEKRAILSLPALDTLEVGASLKGGLSVGSKAQSRVIKATVLADIHAAQNQIDFLSTPEFEAQYNEAREAIENLQKVEGIRGDGASQEDLLQTALRLFDEEQCPVCDTDWDPENFRTLLADKLTKLEHVTKMRIDINNKLESINQFIEQLLSALAALQLQAAFFTPSIGTAIIAEYIKTTRTRIINIQKLFPLDDTLLSLQSITIVESNVGEFLEEIKKATKAIPEPTQQEAARDYLTVAQERFEALQQASLQLKKVEDRTRIAATVYELFNAESNSILDNIYKDVERSFTSLYRDINDDEDKFEAQLTPSSGRLGFDVDFYGRGFFPPGAYHSDGHQDGMGLCLYLALMDHLLQRNFTLAVLDDVLISVDVGHRREVTKMLKNKFPHVQFIMTTHDKTWFEHMKSTGLVKRGSSIRFCKWDVDMGPTQWDDRDIWAELDDHLTKNEVRSAAALLRYYLEYMCQEICQNFRVKVEFRSDSQFTLGELLPGATAALSKCIRKGISSAQSWSQSKIVDELTLIEKTLEEAIMESQAEKWHINPAVHYNEWENFDKKDFEPVVAAFKKLLGQFACPSCNGLLYVFPDRGEKELMRCGCPNVNINLITKT
jgi:recombinational DNA repair ATPase RecF